MHKTCVFLTSFYVHTSFYSYAIVQECWKAAPDKRPTFSELAKNICERLEVMGGYLDLTTPSFPTEVTSITENIPPSTETVAIPNVAIVI